MRIGVITDAHGNLPALLAALTALDGMRCDRIYHLGDAIGIGPFPAECALALTSNPQVQAIMGNHDALFVEGLPDPPPSSMDVGEVRHHQWTHAQLDAQLRRLMAGWPYARAEDIGVVRVLFTHYGLDGSGGGFSPVIAEPTADDLDGMFAEHEADVVFYGHHHVRSEVHGKSRYVNPGSLGCHAEFARFAVFNAGEGHNAVELMAVPYDWDSVVHAFRDRDVPEKEFICRTFFGTEVAFEGHLAP